MGTAKREKQTQGGYFYEGRVWDRPLLSATQGIDKNNTETSDETLTVALMAEPATITGLNGVTTESGLIISECIGGKTDEIIMRFIDVLQLIPSILLAICIASALGNGVMPLVTA